LSSKEEQNLNSENGVILIEFTKGNGLRPASLYSRKQEPELAEKSEQAIGKAMDTIKSMAERVNSTVDNIDKRPTRIEIEFGIRFDAEVGVIVAKATIGANMIVKLSWNDQK
jgi:hypothetical protein